MKTHGYFLVAVLSCTFQAPNLAAQSTPQPEAAPNPSVGTNVADSIAVLERAERVDDTETLLLGLKSEFLAVRKFAAIALSKKARHGALAQLVEGYEANHVYVTGGTESELLQRDTNAAIVSAIDKILHPDKARGGQYSESEMEVIIVNAKRRLSKDSAAMPNAAVQQSKPLGTETMPHVAEVKAIASVPAGTTQEVPASSQSSLRNIFIVMMVATSAAVLLVFILRGKK
jgi:hypothetical protein